MSSDPVSCVGRSTGWSFPPSASVGFGLVGLELVVTFGEAVASCDWLGRLPPSASYLGVDCVDSPSWKAKTRPQINISKLTAKVGTLSHPNSGTSGP